MYTLLRSLTDRRIFVEQLVVFVVALIIAELFYKFHSFTLECIAFLATWYVLDLVMSWARTLLSSRRQ
jgi:hypothetical protein